jgi:hypothetical protein
MAARHDYRTFTKDEQGWRDAWIRNRVENECDGCETISHPDGYDAWRPAERCPVHGADTAGWWNGLNRELDKRWPGTWHSRRIADEDRAGGRNALTRFADEDACTP